jgi:isopenicillin N synthase-like dioxygenase
MSAPPSLPVIDIAPYLSSHDLEARARVSAELHNACLNYGFFYLDFTSFLNSSEPHNLTELGRAFFHLPQEEKDKISLRNQDGARGYARLKENVTGGKADNHEGVDFYRPVENPDKSKPVWGENQWPESMPELETKFMSWTEKMKKLGLIVMEAMAVGLGMSQEEWQHLRAQVDDSFWVMRIIGYPPLPNDDDGFSCGAHRDYGCLTFLYADSTKGALQVFRPGKGGSDAVSAGLPDEQGGEEGHWVIADPIPGCFVCNVGEMWEIWSNGLYKSTLHRVIHRSSSYRISIPFFFEPNFTAEVKPLEAALTIQKLKPELAPKHNYSRVVYGDFLLGKVSNNFSKY